MWVTSLHLPAQRSDWSLIICRDFLLLSSTGDRTLKKHGLWRIGRTGILYVIKSQTSQRRYRLILKYVHCKEILFWMQLKCVPLWLKWKVPLTGIKKHLIKTVGVCVFNIRVTSNTRCWTFSTTMADMFIAIPCSHDNTLVSLVSLFLGWRHTYAKSERIFRVYNKTICHLWFQVTSKATSWLTSPTAYL